MSTVWESDHPTQVWFHVCAYLAIKADSDSDNVSLPINIQGSKSDSEV